MELDENVLEVEKEYIGAGKSFTSIDVGNELKRRGVNVRQREVSKIVRQHFNGDEYAGTGYTRTLIPVRDGSLQAFLYFNISADPKAYIDTNQDALPYKPAGVGDGNAVSPAAGSTVDVVAAVTGANVANDLDAKVSGSGQASPTKVSSGKPVQVLYPGRVFDDLELASMVASKYSKVMHHDGCFYASRIKPKNCVAIEFIEGYRLCSRER